MEGPSLILYILFIYSTKKLEFFRFKISFTRQAAINTHTEHRMINRVIPLEFLQKMHQFSQKIIEIRNILVYTSFFLYERLNNT